MYKKFLLSALLLVVSTHTLVVSSQEGVKLGVPISEGDLTQFDLIAEATMKVGSNKIACKVDMRATISGA